MTEKEASIGVMRIGISVWPLVMNTMISAPLVEVILQSHDVKKREYESEGPMGLVSAMGPEAMSTCLHSDSSKEHDTVSPPHSPQFTAGNETEGVETDDVHYQEGDYVAPY